MTRISKDTLYKLKQNNIKIHPESRISAQKINIGSNTNINGPIRIKGGEKVSIGKFCAMGDYIVIHSSGHDYSKPNIQMDLQNYCGFDSIYTTKGPISIENNVWIGDCVNILSGVTIGDGAIIGAGAVVTNNLPPFSIGVGCPAKVIKYRFSQDIIDQLLDIKWWDWPLDKIKRNSIFFNASLEEGMNLYKLIIP